MLLQNDCLLNNKVVNLIVFLKEEETIYPVKSTYFVHIFV